MIRSLVVARQRNREPAADAADRALLRAAAAGDMAAFERLYRTHYRTIHAFAARVSGSIDLAGEIAGDTFTVVWRRASTFEGRSRVSTWILGIAYRVARRARGRRARMMEEIPLDDTLPAPTTPAADVEWILLREHLARAMARLSPEHRAVVELTYFHGLGYPEIATVLGCPVGTVKTRMMHARQRLRHHLSNPDGDDKEARRGRG